jgi:rhodanese-related sulfurtransferase/DNA-binding transcriptional ArsR family regulator
MSTSTRPKDDLFEQLARVGKALSSPKRLEMLDVLAQGERSVEVLAQATALKLTTASAHLQVLRNGGLVQSRKDGTRIFYRLSSDAVARLYVDLRDVAVLHLAETTRAAVEYLGRDEVEAVDRDALLSRIERGNLVLLDVRPKAEFEAGHIEGAVSIPLDELYERIRELPAGLEVVAYCRGEYCVLAYEAVRLLRRKGRPARRLKGGMIEWRLEHRPVVTEPA